DISNAPDYDLVSITPGINAQTTYNQYGIFIEDNYAYYSGDSGFNVLDISNPSAPFNVGGVDTGGPEGPIRKEGNTVYVGGSRSFLSIYRQFDTSTSVEISTAKRRFYFASTTGGASTSARGFYLSSRGGGDGEWQATVDKDWLTCTPVSADYGELSIDASGLEPGSYSGSVTITGPEIINSQQLEVVLNVIASQSSAEPFGLVATPEDGTTVSGSVPFTGWVLDDIEVAKVEIALVYGNGESFIGEAALVEGARPDVEAAYPGYPRGERAGWGYMLLTQGLPGGLDGSFTFRVYASDVEGNRTLLGTRNLMVSNSTAVAPFGAIDTPLQGGTATGTSYSNYGWVLTPQPNTIPIDGSTIMVWIDGEAKGHPVYNNPREDVAALFPGYANSGGPMGYFVFDTTQYGNGTHTIAWGVEDNAGNGAGIGSRYFQVRNEGQNRHGEAMKSKSQKEFHSAAAIEAMPVSKRESIDPEKKGKRKPRDLVRGNSKKENSGVTLSIGQMERVELSFPGIRSIYRMVGKRPVHGLIGSTVDTKKGILYWQPGPGFVGRYDFVVVSRTGNGMEKTNLSIHIK
ncbi:MAG: hypothetical protein GY765_18585, partial [bacterium]|nr:hypothetical protein [bacterium]